MSHTRTAEHAFASDIRGRTRPAASAGAVLLALYLFPTIGAAQSLDVRSNDGNSTQLSLATIRNITFTEQDMVVNYLTTGTEVFPMLDIAGMTYADLVTATGASYSSNDESSLQLQPNPVSDRMELRYSVPRPGDVTWEIRDARGQVVYRSPTTMHKGGVWTGTWDRTTSEGQRVTPGLYICHLNAAGVRIARSFVVVN